MLGQREQTNMVSVQCLCWKEHMYILIHTVLSFTVKNDVCVEFDTT